jgi:hypothetical protein
MKKNYLKKIFFSLLGLLLSIITVLSAQDLASSDLTSFQYSALVAGMQDHQNSLNDVLKVLHDEYDVKFSYKNHTIENKMVENEIFKHLIKEKKIDEILEHLLIPQGLQFEKMEDIYIIFPAHKNKPNEIKKKQSKELKTSYQNKHLLQIASLARRPMDHKLINQALSVSGRVTSQEDGEPLPGVNVIVKGTTTGTVTDLEGNYNINVPSENDILIFSSIGFTSQEVAVNGRTTIDVVLAEDVQSLSEVIVVGYGTVKKKDLTGSVSRVDTVAKCGPGPAGSGLWGFCNVSKWKSGGSDFYQDQGWKIYQCR